MICISEQNCTLSGRYINYVTNKCVYSCDKDDDNATMYGDSSTKHCVYQCGLDLYKNPQSYLCVSNCVTGNNKKLFIN